MIIAFHGQGGSGQMLYDDMGRPEWEIQCPDWTRRTLAEILDLIHMAGDQVFLFGYSLGGEALQKFSGLTNVIGFLAYEAPLFDLGKRPYGKAPILWIQNHRGRGTCSRRNRQIMGRSRDLWSREREMDELAGYGRHTRFEPGKWPMLRHNWDQSLNPAIASWMLSKS